jgi:sulfur carrier protein
MMTILLNNELLAVPENCTVATALTTANINITANGMAVAVNSDVVPRNNWENYALKANDKIMIIRATQGG